MKVIYIEEISSFHLKFCMKMKKRNEQTENLLQDFYGKNNSQELINFFKNFLNSSLCKLSEKENHNSSVLKNLINNTQEICFVAITTTNRNDRKFHTIFEQEIVKVKDKQDEYDPIDLKFTEYKDFKKTTAFFLPQNFLLQFFKNSKKNTDFRGINKDKSVFINSFFESTLEQDYKQWINFITIAKKKKMVRTTQKKYLFN